VSEVIQSDHNHYKSMCLLPLLLFSLITVNVLVVHGAVAQLRAAQTWILHNGEVAQELVDSSSVFMFLRLEKFFPKN